MKRAKHAALYTPDDPIESPSGMAVQQLVDELTAAIDDFADRNPTVQLQWVISAVGSVLTQLMVAAVKTGTYGGTPAQLLQGTSESIEALMALMLDEIEDEKDEEGEAGRGATA